MNTTPSPPDEPDRCPDCGRVQTKQVNPCPDCGFVGAGCIAGHFASCPSLPKVRWWDEAEVRAVKMELRRRITATCAEIDQLHGNPPGSAERGTYFWLWPPSDSTAIDTLQNLLNDAREFLATGKFPRPAAPTSAACQHSPASRRSTKPRRQRRAKVLE
jgi:hypothetical protein